MIRSPGMVRGVIEADVRSMLKHIGVMLSMRDPTEFDVLKTLQEEKIDIEVKTINFLMEFFGHRTAPCEPRFDKTRRALAKRKPKPLRGANTYDNSKERKRRAPLEISTIPTVMEAE